MELAKRDFEPGYYAATYKYGYYFAWLNVVWSDMLTDSSDLLVCSIVSHFVHQLCDTIAGKC